MINTRDEILRVFAANILKDLVHKFSVPLPNQPDLEEQEPEIDPARFPKTLLELEEQRPEIDPARFPKTLLELEEQVDEPVVPEVSEDKPISIREQDEQDNSRNFDEPHVEHPWLLQNAGTAAWAAEYYPEAYLRGHAPFTKYVNRPENKDITDMLMGKIVSSMPEKYFEWRLDKNYKLENWEEPAVKALIEQDPERALMIGLPRVLFSKRYGLLPLLWVKMVGKEGTGGFEEQFGANMFKGLVRKRMRELAIQINKHNPEFLDQIQFKRFADELINDHRNPLKNMPERISPRDKSPRGSLEWLAEQYPQTYLKGVDDKSLSKGHRRERGQSDDNLTYETIRRLLETNPIKFFEWGLNRPNDLKKYIDPAAKKIVETNPHQAVMADLFKMPVFHSLLPALWKNLTEISQQYGKDTEWFPGYLANRMVSLLKIIKVRHPQYFDEKIKNTPLHKRLEEVDDLIRSKKWYGY